MNSSPRPPSLDILDLLPHPLELGFRPDDELRPGHAVCLRPDRVDLAIHLLKQEVQLAAAGFAARRQRPPVLEVCPEPGHLLADVRSRRGPYDLLRDHRLVNRQLEAKLANPFVKALFEACPSL